MADDRLKRLAGHGPGGGDALPEMASVAQGAAAGGSGGAASRARPLNELTDLMDAGRLCLSDVVVELADGGSDCDLAILLGRRTASRTGSCLKQLWAPAELPVMRLCRAAGLDLEAFSAVLRLRRRRRPFGSGEIARLLLVYRGMWEDG